MPKIIIWRHRKENLKKCSLSGLECDPRFSFHTYPIDPLPNLSNAVLLAPDGRPLSTEDSNKDLLLLDGTWRYAEVMGRQLPKMERRSIPSHWTTAYPRRQDEERGLASIEAIYAACHTLGWETEGLLENYHWEGPFLVSNR